MSGVGGTRSTWRKWENRLAPVMGAIFIFVLSSVVFFVVPSLMMTNHQNANDAFEIVKTIERARSQFFPNLATLGLTILLTSIVSVLIHNYISLRQDHKQIINAFGGKHVRARLLPSLAIFIFLTLVIVGAASSLTWTDFTARLANNPGGWFAILTGIASLLGVYLTFMQVIEIKNSIVSFSDFIDRVQTLINETERNDIVRMMLHTPATGCLALPDDIWQSLSRTIIGAQCKFQITCLSQKTEKAWFEQYKDPADADKSAQTESRIAVGRKWSKKIRDTVEPQGRASAAAAATEEGVADAGVVVGEWNDLPQCYFIANKSRAIVVVPFFLPTPSINIFVRSVHYRNVDMVGFETSNHHIVDTVRTEILTRRKALEARQTELLRLDDELLAQEKRQSEEPSNAVVSRGAVS